MFPPFAPVMMVLCPVVLSHCCQVVSCPDAATVWASPLKSAGMIVDSPNWAELGAMPPYCLGDQSACAFATRPLCRLCIIRWYSGKYSFTLL